MTNDQINKLKTNRKIPLGEEKQNIYRRFWKDKVTEQRMSQNRKQSVKKLQNYKKKNQKKKNQTSQLCLFVKLTNHILH